MSSERELLITRFAEKVKHFAAYHEREINDRVVLDVLNENKAEFASFVGNIGEFKAFGRDIKAKLNI